MIEIKAVNGVKSGSVLFRDFTWRIHPGENWIITGPNGSGKTLLLEMLSGMLHLANGEIHYDFIHGETWDARFAERRRSITYIPAHALQPLVGGQDLFYQQRYYSIGDTKSLRVKNVLNAEANVLDSLKLPYSLSVDHLLDIEVERLSNGQLKKLLMVKSFLKGIPKLLLLDYPFEGLDHKSREDLSRLIDFFSEFHGVQTIIVDHQPVYPKCINRKLTLNNFEIEKIEELTPEVQKTVSYSNLASSSSLVEGEEVIRVNNLQLRYRSHVVLENFNWLVRRGDRWALTGRNGAGKTTLFSLIFADHPQAYAQEIYLFGKRRGSGESIWDIKKRINYLGPEQVTFLSSDKILLSGLDYIASVVPAFSPELLEKLVEHFDAGPIMKKQLNTLSSGELQLIMIVICFLSEKELWLLDEPFQFLDGRRKRQLTEYLSGHLKRDITLILITHNDGDLSAWTDKRMIL